MNKNKTLIIGSNGNIGKEVVRILTDKGEDMLLATSREALKPNQVQLNLVTGEGLQPALQSVDQVFLLAPAGFADQYAVLSPVIKEAKRQGLRKVVLMTAMGVNADPNNPLRRAEIELEQSGIDYNIVRPNWFMQNFNTFWADGINTKNTINLPAGDAQVSFVDTRDIALVIAQLLTTDEFKNQDFVITGPDSVTHSDIANAISKQTDRTIEYRDTAPSALKEDLTGKGVPEDYTDLMLHLFGFIREGYNASVSNDFTKITGLKQKTINDYAADYSSSWQGN